MRHFFLSENLFDERFAIIKGKDVHHIKNVLRFRKGDQLKLITPNGQTFQARIDTISNKQICTEILKPDQPIIKPKTHVTIAQSMLKEKKMDRIIRQATELGVSRWISFVSERCASRPDAHRMQQKLQRWKKIVQSAAQQCNGNIPEIHDQLMDMDDIYSLCTENQPGYFFWEQSDNPIFRPKGVCHSKSIVLVFGPEGGFSEKEVARARNAGFTISSLGPRILRSETATITGLVLVQYFFDNFGMTEK